MMTTIITIVNISIKCWWFCSYEADNTDIVDDTDYDVHVAENTDNAVEYTDNAMLTMQQMLKLLRMLTEILTMLMMMTTLTMLMMLLTLESQGASPSSTEPARHRKSAPLPSHNRFVKEGKRNTTIGLSKKEKNTTIGLSKKEKEIRQ